MRKLLGLFAVVILVSLAACSSTSQANPFEIFVKNLTAAQCDNPQAALANIPLGFLTQAQALQAVEAICTGMFGTAPAPTPAPGMQPAIPGPTPAPSAAPTISAQ